MFARNIKFTTTENDQEILELPEVKAVLYDILSADSEEEYDKLTQNGFYANVDVFSKDTRIKINYTTWNDLIENTLYSTNNIIKVRSVRSEVPATGVIVFTLEDN